MSDTEIITHNGVELELEPVENVEVPDEVDDFYLKLWLIRDTGAVNMMNASGVAHVAEECGFEDFAEWLRPDRGTRHNRDYPTLLSSKVHAVVRMDNGRVNVGETSWVNAFSEYV